MPKRDKIRYLKKKERRKETRNVERERCKPERKM
jgi:hypothetical protein